MHKSSAFESESWVWVLCIRVQVPVLRIWTLHEAWIEGCLTLSPRKYGLKSDWSTLSDSSTTSLVKWYLPNYSTINPHARLWRRTLISTMKSRIQAAEMTVIHLIIGIRCKYRLQNDNSRAELGVNCNWSSMDVIIIKRRQETHQKIRQRTWTFITTTSYTCYKIQ